MTLRSLAPEASASTNFATWAGASLLIRSPDFAPAGAVRIVIGQRGAGLYASEFAPSTLAETLFVVILQNFSVILQTLENRGQKMSSERRVATVFGGTGFIGRYIVQRLAAQDYTVRVAVRNVPGALFLQTMGRTAQIVPLYAPLGAEALMARATEGAELVVNATGLLSENRKGDFNRVHVEGAGQVARLAASSGARHIVHLSAIGADAASPSLYGRSKAAGEAAVRAAFPQAVILRPSIVFGAEDSFFNRFAAMASFLPVLPIVGGDTKFQPVYVGDVAAAALAATSPQVAGATIELGGPDVRTFKQLIEYMLKVINRRRIVIDLPPGLAQVQAQFLQRLPGKLLTVDQIRMLERDNVVSLGALGLPEIGIVPIPMDLIVPAYLSSRK